MSRSKLKIFRPTSASNASILCCQPGPALDLVEPRLSSSLERFDLAWSWTVVGCADNGRHSVERESLSQFFKYGASRVVLLRPNTWAGRFECQTSFVELFSGNRMVSNAHTQMLRLRGHYGGSIKISNFSLVGKAPIRRGMMRWFKKCATVGTLIKCLVGIGFKISYGN